MSRVCTVIEARTPVGSRSTFNPLNPSGWPAAGTAHRSTTSSETPDATAGAGRGEAVKMPATFLASRKVEV